MAKTQISTVDEILDAIGNLKVLELNELVKKLEQTYGITASAPVAVAPVASTPSAAPQVEEKTEFDVILTDIGGNKIQVLKVVRAITGLGLKEANDLVNSVPKPIKEGVKKEEANEIKAKIEEAGGAIEIK